jgi:hypothetical protein
MNENIRVSDSDRERVAGQLREHYAQGRLDQDELDERITATLSARTFGDLRAVVTDLPGQPFPELFPQLAGQAGLQQHRERHLARHYHRGPRVFPLLAVGLIAALVLTGGVGGVIIALVKVVLVLWLLACVAAFFVIGRLRRRFRGLARQAELSGRWQQTGWQHRH